MLTDRFLLIAFFVLTGAQAWAAPPLHEGIDRLIEARAGGALAGPANDAEFLRRVHLDLNGIVPTAEEVAPVHSIKRLSGHEVDVHRDGLRFAVSRFESHGRGGNGRRAKPEEYVSNRGIVICYNLYENPKA